MTCNVFGLLCHHKVLCKAGINEVILALECEKSQFECIFSTISVQMCFPLKRLVLEFCLSERTAIFFNSHNVSKPECASDLTSVSIYKTSCKYILSFNLFDGVIPMWDRNVPFMLCF